MIKSFTHKGLEKFFKTGSLVGIQTGISGRTTTAEQLLPLSVRKRLGLSQTAFAELIKTPVATLRDWEQGRFTPSGAVLCLLQIMDKHPELAQELTT